MEVKMRKITALMLVLVFMILAVSCGKESKKAMRLTRNLPMSNGIRVR